MKKQDAAMLLYSLSYLMSESIETLKGTTLYKHRTKNLLKQVETICDELIHSIQGNANEDSEALEQHYKMISCLEYFVNAAKTKDVVSLIALLDEFQKGEIKIIEGGEIKDYDIS